MAETQKKIKCGFAVTKTYEGQKDFDQDYVSIEIKKVVKKIGPGEEDFVLEDKVIENRVNIAESINAHAGDAGIQSYLRPFIQAGVSPMENAPSFEQLSKAPIQDFSNMPEDLAGQFDLSKKAIDLFDALPLDLKGDAKNAEEFFKGFTIEKFNSFIQSRMPKPIKKNTVDSTVKKDEDNKNGE